MTLKGNWRSCLTVSRLRLRCARRVQPLTRILAKEDAERIDKALATLETLVASEGWDLSAANSAASANSVIIGTADASCKSAWISLGFFFAFGIATVAMFSEKGKHGSNPVFDSVSAVYQASWIIAFLTSLTAIISSDGYHNATTNWIINSVAWAANCVACVAYAACAVIPTIPVSSIFIVMAVINSIPVGDIIVVIAAIFIIAAILVYVGFATLANSADAIAKRAAWAAFVASVVFAVLHSSNTFVVITVCIIIAIFAAIAAIAAAWAACPVTWAAAHVARAAAHAARAATYAARAAAYAARAVAYAGANAARADAAYAARAVAYAGWAGANAARADAAYAANAAKAAQAAVAAAVQRTFVFKRQYDKNINKICPKSKLLGSMESDLYRLLQMDFDKPFDCTNSGPLGPLGLFSPQEKPKLTPLADPYKDLA